MIEYKRVDSEPLNAIKMLYEQHGWMAYLNDDAKLMRAFDQSLYALGVYDDERLIGFIRCVGDGEHIVLVQDLIVAKTYQRRGIGRELMKRVSERYADVRKFMLLTDAMDRDANAFYQAIGMQKIAENGCISYMR